MFGRSLRVWVCGLWLLGACQYDAIRGHAETRPAADGGLDAAPGGGAGRDAAADASDAAPARACDAGFSLGDAGECQDDDKCAARPCMAPALCTNELGSYRCSCPSGYNDLGVGDCRDVDECKVANDCASVATCSNTPGGYSCRCPAYYTPLNGGRSCVDHHYVWELDVPGRSLYPLEDKLGNLYMSGAFNASLTLGDKTWTSVGGGDVLIAKLDPARKVLWAHVFGGPGDDVAHWLAIDSKGDVAISGFTDGGLDFGNGVIPTTGKRLRFLAKFKGSDGSVLWSYALPNIDDNAPATEWEGGVTIDSADNVIFSNRFDGPVDINGTVITPQAGIDSFLAKFSSSGTLLWSKSWPGSGDESVRGVFRDAHDNLFVAGDFTQSMTLGAYTLNTAGGHDVFIAKLSPAGDVLWAHSLGSADNDLVGRFAVDVGGNLALSIYFGGTLQLGNRKHVGRGGWDIAVARWDPSGKLLWSTQFGGPMDDIAGGISTDSKSNIYLGGIMEGQADFGEGPRQSRGKADILLMKLSPSGKTLWTQIAGGAEWDSASYVAVGPSDHVFIGGWYDVGTDLGGGAHQNSDMFALELEP